MSPRRPQLAAQDARSISDASRYLRIRISALRRKIERGELRVDVTTAGPRLRAADLAAFAMSDEYYAAKLREGEESTEAPYVPGHLREYHNYHQTLNNFTWLLKSHLSTREQLRDRNLRLDLLLQSYLNHVPDSFSLRRLLLGPTGALRQDQSARAGASLLKLWYNELAYATPQLAVPLVLDRRGVKDNLEDAARRMTFPSWRMVQAYYVLYNSARTLADATGIDYDSTQHHAPWRAFKATKLAPAKRGLLNFPLDLAHPAAPTLFNSINIPRPPHYKFAYSHHPRPPHLDFDGVGEAVLASFAHGRKHHWSHRVSGEPYTLVDFMYQFRVWANYVDIDNVVALKSSGLRAYLDLDLHTITFFYAAIAEIAAIACLGAERVLLLAEEFHSEFVRPDDALWQLTRLHPLNVRLQIYGHMNRLDGMLWQPEIPAARVDTILV